MDELKVVYEDNHIIVVVKQPGIITQADGKDNEDMLTLVKEYIKIKYSKPGDVFIGLVHRLDKPVGGLILFARTSKAAGRLSEQLRKGDIKKTYLAVVSGKLKSRNGLLQGYLCKDAEKNISKICDENDKGAKYAELRYEVVEETGDHSLLMIELLTGRSHQIRVQLSDMGNPIVGDRKYGRDNSHYTVALWAYELIFHHPVKKEVLRYISIPESKGIWKKFSYEKIDEK